MTMIEIPNITAGWKAGQHVRIRIASTGMGYLRWAENHPFTIASVSKVRPVWTIALFYSYRRVDEKTYRHLRD